MTDAEGCTLPPKGWHCNLPAGHEGPCPTWRNYSFWRNVLAAFAGRTPSHGFDWPTERKR